MGKDEVHGLDAVEILGVEKMLAAGPSALLAVEVTRHRFDHRIDHRDTGQVEVAALLLKGGPGHVVDQSEDHDAWPITDAGEDAV